MPKCQKASCRHLPTMSPSQFTEHIRKHRRPIRKSYPTQNKCPNCGKVLAYSFQHFNGCS